MRGGGIGKRTSFAKSRAFAVAAALCRRVVRPPRQIRLRLNGCGGQVGAATVSARIVAIALFVTVAGMRGTAAELRIVSLGPAITDQVSLLGMASNLVGVTTFCRLPAGVAMPPHVGTVTGISVEQVLALHPDLVCAIGLTHPRDVSQLETLGLRVVRFNYARNFDEIETQFMDLGGRLGREAEARVMVNEARVRLGALAERIRGQAPPSVFVEVGTRPLFTANRDSFINDMVARAGGRNVALDAQGGFFSREQVLAQNPDVILIVTMGVAADEERAAWLATQALSVSRTRRVHVLEAYTVCSPTPARFVEATEQMAVLFHPGSVVAP